MTDVTAGVALIVAAFFLGLRQLLLSPKQGGWPPAPSFVRVAMFLMMIAFVFQGVSLFNQGLDFGPARVSAAGTFMCVSIALYNTIMCVNVARQYYPKAIWDRIERILTIAQCRNGWVLVALTRAGFKVFVPGRKTDPTPLSPEEVLGLMPDDLPGARS